MSTERRFAAAALVAAAMSAALTGCGTPAAPLPPSLNLPDRVDDLNAIRTGGQVTLHWTMPRRNTDKLLIRSPIDVHICRTESAGCEEATRLQLQPGAAGAFSEVLPRNLAEGAPRPLRYSIELQNARGRSAGTSNVAVVLAGQAPSPVTGLDAEAKRSGVVLRWNALGPDESIRLYRVLLNPPEAKPDRAPLAPPREPVHQSLLVDHDTGVAIDKTVQFDRSYEYRAQRVARVEVSGATVELAGDISAPVRVDVRNVFPPAPPTELAAVATVTEGAPPSIDLSWQPSADTDVAGYFVYRREGQTSWQRISGPGPIIAPAFRDTAVIAGHAYFYAVSAVDSRGNESSRSAETQETVPGP